MPITSPSTTRPRRARGSSTFDLSNAADAGQLRILPQLLMQVIQAPNTAAAARAVTRCLPAELQHCRLAVGLVGRDGMCQLLAVTGHNRLDQRSERVRALEAALDESILVNGPLAYSRCQMNDMPAKTLEHLARLTGSHWVTSYPLRDGAGRLTGAWLVWGESDDLKAASAWLKIHQQPVATVLQIVAKAHQGVLARLAETFHNRFESTRKRRLVTVAALAAVALLLLPIPYQIPCGCVVEPVTRRYVAAPFNATLARTLVKPGDVVTMGQQLLELDGREIVWELASQQAAYEKAQKGRDAALADRKTSAAQLARLEMKQLEYQITLLRNRQANLKINSPFDGVVISGDLQRVEGAPVTTGQTLLEIAPLDRVIVEVAVPERSIAQLREKTSTSVRLDAFPGQSWTGSLTTIHPRAELRDAEQIFVAELELANPDGQLRPGMRGRAKVNSGWAPTGWILFHKPYYALARWLGW